MCAYMYILNTSVKLKRHVALSSIQKFLIISVHVKCISKIKYGYVNMYFSISMTL